MATIALRPETILVDPTTGREYFITNIKWRNSDTRIYRAFDLLRRANQVENIQEIKTFSDTWTPCVALWATFCADEDQATDLRETVVSLQLTPYANLLSILHCFTIGRVMYTITPFMSHGSLVTVMRSRPAFREGLPEKAISIALREALNGLMQMHQANVAHKNFGADQILFSSFGDAVPSIKLGHGPLIFKFSSLSKENPELALEQRVAPEIIPIPHPPPPEGMTYLEKELKIDLWMVGVAAMELAYDRFPFATRGSFMRFRGILVRSGKFRFIDDDLKKKKMSPFFQQMVAECFAPLGQRQDARTLKRHIFFTTYDKESVTELGKILLATEG